MKVLLISKIGQGNVTNLKTSRRKVTNFSEVTKLFTDKNFPRLFLLKSISSEKFFLYLNSI